MAEFFGTAALLIEDDCYPRIARMSVVQSARRKGVASALLNCLIRDAQNIDAQSIKAHTEPDWSDAVSFYANAGFKMTGEGEADIHLVLAID